MNTKQSVLKFLYPLIMKMTGLGAKGKILNSTNSEIPTPSFYKLNTVLNSGEKISFENFSGKKVLIVNTASDCGFTNQYEELQELFEQQKERLIVLGFPSNDFKEQEKGGDEEIAQFCKINFGVTFPIAQKSQVVKGERQNLVFKWLSDKDLNGWNNKQPEWNFSKYLINEKGALTHYFGPAVSPLHKEVIKLINK